MNIMKSVMQKLIAVFGITLGIGLTIATSAAKQLTGHVDVNELSIFLKYANKFNAVDKEMNSMVFLTKMNEYSHWIVTAAIIIIILSVFLWTNSRRK